MKIHPILATAMVTAVLAMQAWMVSTISDLKAEVAVLKSEVHQLNGNTTAIVKSK